MFYRVSVAYARHWQCNAAYVHSTGTVSLNLILDPLFIFGFGPIPGNGVAGAAMAGIVTQGLSAIIGIVILFRGKMGIKIHWSQMKWDFPWVKRLFELGIPSSVDMSTRASGMTVMVMLVTSFGSQVVAAYWHWCAHT
ncbi:MAG: hypothetical protein U5L96_06820 [Owenweeksia sp.]|nr:hypothetical protein [Owenweeksia sp.]